MWQADEVEAVFLVKQLLQFYQDCGTGNTAELIEYMRKTTETRLFAELYGRYVYRRIVCVCMCAWRHRLNSVVNAPRRPIP